MKIFLGIFGLMTGFLIGVKSENEITRAMRKYDVIHDVVSKGAEQQLEVVYKTNEIIYPGYEMTPTETKDKPIEVSWNFDQDAYYTLIFTSPDSPSRTNRSFSEVIKWLVVNIPGNDIDSGDVLAEYIAVGPPKDAGLLRYVYFIYKQKGKEQFDETPIDKYTFNTRKNFSTRGFTQKHNMGPSIEAANFLQARYDDYVPVLNKQFNCC